MNGNSSASTCYIIKKSSIHITHSTFSLFPIFYTARIVIIASSLHLIFTECHPPLPMIEEAILCYCRTNNTEVLECSSGILLLQLHTWPLSLSHFMKHIFQHTAEHSGSYTCFELAPQLNPTFPVQYSQSSADLAIPHGTWSLGKKLALHSLLWSIKQMLMHLVIPGKMHGESIEGLQAVSLASVTWEYTWCSTALLHHQDSSQQRGQYAPATVLSLRDSTPHLALTRQRGYCHTHQFSLLWASIPHPKRGRFSVKSLLFLLPAALIYWTYSSDSCYKCFGR